jgi:hypothetical protein
MARLLVGEFKMKRVGCVPSICWAVLALATFTAPANATTFTGTFNITSQAASDPALVIVTNPPLGTNSSPFSFNLTPGSPTATINNLFKIGTPEAAINISDDLAFKDITVAFSFTAPPPPFGGGVTGETRGRFLFNDGILHWDGSINVAFGNGGLLGIQLFDTDFDLADNGQVQFEDVKAKFTLLLAPQQDAPAATPLPAELPLFAGGLGALGLLGWRRKKKAATLTA